MQTKEIILKSLPASLNDLKLNPKDNGDSYQITCPNCNTKEAFIYKNNPTIICSRKNHCDYSISLWDYAKNINNLDQQGTLFYFCKMAGVELPKSEYHHKEEKTAVLEKILSYFQDILFSSSGKPTLNYLLNERKYTKDEIKLMGLGHYPSQKELKNFLKREKLSYKNIEDLIFTKGFGDSYLIDRI